MLALRKTSAAFGLEFQDVPEPPPPGPGEVVLRVDAVGICGSDVHAYEWTAGYEFMVPHLPLSMGHEFCGTVIRNGTGSGFAEGDRVTVIPFVFCGACANCRGGDTRNCLNRQGIGLTRDGGFQAEVRVPSRCCVALPASISAVGTMIALNFASLVVGQYERTVRTSVSRRTRLRRRHRASRRGAYLAILKLGRPSSQLIQRPCLASKKYA
jgi:threonine dehydrogenase-like Zn-dependent dehydrogenase